MVYPSRVKKKPEMLQLSGSTGKKEADVHGAQRIYSRKDTQAIVMASASASSIRDFLKLGKLVYDATKSQDAAPAEYADN